MTLKLVFKCFLGVVAGALFALALPEWLVHLPAVGTARADSPKGKAVPKHYLIVRYQRVAFLSSGETEKGPERFALCSAPKALVDERFKEFVLKNIPKRADDAPELKPDTQNVEVTVLSDFTPISAEQFNKARMLAPESKKKPVILEILD